MAVAKALRGWAPLLDQNPWFPTKLGPTKNFRPPEFNFGDT